MKTLGLIPARMAASRFPGKPLHPLAGRPMIEHVYLRAKMYAGWSRLAVCTCDVEIEDFCKSKQIPVVMTGSHHTRALDRVAEATERIGESVAPDDIVVCVQGDEPMMRPDMIDATIAPLLADPAIPCTVLAMHIVDEALWRNQDTVKIIHNDAGEVLYTSRTPVPWSKMGFSPDLKARRIYGILGFRWRRLQEFTRHPETRLEQLEACDSNRILDMPFAQYIAPYPYVESFSIDSPEDAQLVEGRMRSDELFKRYAAPAGR